MASSITNNLVQSLAKAMARKDVSRSSPAVPANAPAKGTVSAPIAKTNAKAVVKTVVTDGIDPDVMPAMLGSIGEEIAHDLTWADDLIQHTIQNPEAFSSNLNKTHWLIESLCRKAIAMQQIAQLANQRKLEAHDQMPLHDVVKLVLEERSAENSASGIVITPRFRPVTVVADLGLLMGLISAALYWVSEFGTVIRLSTGLKSWPMHGQLSFSASQGVRMQDDVDTRNAIQQSISWHLMQHTAQAMGVTIKMDESPSERSLLIEFPRTIVPKESLSIMDMDHDNSAKDSFSPQSAASIAGAQVLLISPDLSFCTRVRDICKGLNLVCDHVPSIDRAERACELTIPHLIMCEETLANDQFETLLDDLQRHTPGFPTIMVSDDGYGFELSDWSGQHKSRVSRAQIETQLPSALISELTRSI